MTEIRRLAAIVALDVVGYSRLMGADEAWTLAALKRQRSVIDPIVASHGGRLVKTTGDGLLLEFPSAVGAVRAALDVQRQAGAANADQPADRRLEFRIGINVGDILADSGDIFGDGVNVAARLEQLAHPGGICISGRVHEDLAGRLPISAEDLGEVTLKNIARPLRAYRLEIDPAIDPRRPGPRPLARRIRTLAIAGGAALVSALAVILWLALRADEAPPRSEASALSAPLVAVLPFANQSGDPAQDYFSDGLTEDVISALGRFSSVAVLARNAVTTMKGSRPDAEATRRALGARYIVEGSARRADDRVRVQARLIDGSDGRVLWSDRFDGEGKDVLRLQDELVTQIVGTIASQIGRVEMDRVRRRPPVNFNSYDLTLQARAQVELAYRQRRPRAAYATARALFERALQVDSNNADAQVGIARILQRYVVLGFSESPTETVADAEKIVRDVLRRDPLHAPAHATLGQLLTHTGRFDEALLAIDRALKINGSDAETYAARASVLLWVGRIRDARSANALADRLDPAGSSRHDRLFNAALIELLEGSPDRARLMLEERAAPEPTYSLTYVLLAIAQAQLNRQAELARTVAIIHKLDPLFDAREFGTRLQDPAHRRSIADGLRRAGLLTP